MILYPELDLVSVHKYVQKQDMDIKKDRWMHHPMAYGLAIYAYNYADKYNKEV